MTEETASNYCYQVNNSNLYNGDILASLICQRAFCTPLRIGILSFFFAIFIHVVLSLVTGTFRSGSSYFGYIEDRFFQIGYPILAAVIGGYYVWVFPAPYDVLGQIVSNGVVFPRDQEIEDASKYLTSSKSTYIALIVAIAVVFAGTATGLLARSSWYNYSAFSIVVMDALHFLLAFIATSAILRLRSNALFLGHLMKEIRLQPLHPDKIGGLLPLGKYALRTLVPFAIGASIAVFAELWLVSLGYFAIGYGFHLGIVLYIVFAPILFFSPLLAAHRAMVEAKNRSLIEISKEFDETMSIDVNETAASSEELQFLVEKTSLLQQRHKVVSSYPTWPLDGSVVRRTVFTFLLPLISFIAPIVIDLLS